MLGASRRSRNARPNARPTTAARSPGTTASTSVKGTWCRLECFRCPLLCLPIVNVLRIQPLIHSSHRRPLTMYIPIHIPIPCAPRGQQHGPRRYDHAADGWHMLSNPHCSSGCPAALAIAGCGSAPKPGPPPSPGPPPPPGFPRWVGPRKSAVAWKMRPRLSPLLSPRPPLLRLNAPCAVHVLIDQSATGGCCAWWRWCILVTSTLPAPVPSP